MLEGLLAQGQAPGSAQRRELVTASGDVAAPLGGCSGQGSPSAADVSSAPVRSVARVSPVPLLMSASPSLRWGWSWNERLPSLDAVDPTLSKSPSVCPLLDFSYSYLPSPTLAQTEKVIWVPMAHTGSEPVLSPRASMQVPRTTSYTFITVGNLTALQRVLSQSIQFTALTCHGEGLLECLSRGAEKRKSGSGAPG